MEHANISLLFEKKTVILLSPIYIKHHDNSKKMSFALLVFVNILGASI